MMNGQGILKRENGKKRGAGTRLTGLLTASLLPFLLADPALASAAGFGEGDGDGIEAIERISVIGSRQRKFEIPGAATYIGPEEIEVFEYDDIHRILRQVPGVNIQEEDGFGLRPNIGIRGTGVDRSSRITLMEDGVLIAPAPYAAPAAYYFPTAGRLNGVEVRKGSSAIKFGPRTTGGAINLMSTPIPGDMSAVLRARVGEHGQQEFHGILGGTSGQVGFLLETFQANNDGFKTLPSGADTGFDIEDYLVKFRTGFSEGASETHYIEFKLGKTNQTSNETYLGLTDADFAADPFQRYAASANDRFNSTHYQFQALHYYEVSPAFDLSTVAYYNKFERDWFKLDDLDFDDGRGRIRPRVLFEDPTNPLNVAALAILRGEADSGDDALQLRHNARDYYSWGIFSVAGFTFGTGTAGHDLEVGLRYHEDQEDRLQNRENFRMESGVLVPTSVDPAGSQANRVADASAFAAYVQDEISWNNWTFVPGLRFETINLARTDFAKSDPDRLLGAASQRKNDVNVLIPGLGIIYEYGPSLRFLLGVHRGFGPPGPSSADASEEESVNIEAGARYENHGLFIEAIGFFNDYSNLLGTCTNAAGCLTGDVGDQFNGGDVKVMGVEIGSNYTIELAPGWFLPLHLNYTYTDAEFRTSFTNGFWGDVIRGDKLPYIPPHQLYFSAGLEYDAFATTLALNYTSETRNQAGRGAIPALERIDGRIVVDWSLRYRLNSSVRIFAIAENLFDETTVVARRPYGARPGKPQTFIGGLEVSF